MLSLIIVAFFAALRSFSFSHRLLHSISYLANSSQHGDHELRVNCTIFPLYLQLHFKFDLLLTLTAGQNVWPAVEAEAPLNELY